MINKLIISEINRILNPLGFIRKKTVWNRNINGYVDVVDLQMSKLNDQFTINVGIVDKFVSNICWDNSDGEFFDEPSCTIRSRIGFLYGELDRWWPLDSTQCELLDHKREISEAITNKALPFFDKLHTTQEMIKYQDNSPTVEYPPDSIYHAILLFKHGNLVKYTEIIDKLHNYYNSVWQEKIDDIVYKLDISTKS